MEVVQLLITLLLIAQSLSDDWSASCNKTRCTCKWMNGKKSALCNSADHFRIPMTLSAELQVLSLNENNISYLNRQEFYQNGLEHLQRIYLRKSRVRHVHRDAFKELKILVEIDLSENAIETLEPGTFSGNDRLRVLYLNGNPLRRLCANQFPDLPHLRTLDLHNCAIERVDEHAFLRLPQMEFLNLKNNSIDTMSVRAFSHLSDLKTLLLDENPWNCDCKLRAFRNWYVESSHEMLTCSLPPRLTAIHWDQLTADQFGCLPVVQLTVDHNGYSGEMGSWSNVSFHCLVSGDPTPEIHWELNGNRISEGFNVELLSSSKSDNEQEESTKAWSNLTIHNVTNYDSGTYSCHAKNFIGAVEENATLFLPEVLFEHVIVNKHVTLTFWYFGLIVGTFSTIFSLLLVSVAVCFCRKAALQRSLRRNRGELKKKQKQRQMTGTGEGTAAGGCPMMMTIKDDVSFTEHEKNLLNLSLTTTNDRRLDSCELLANTPSTTMTIMNNSSGGGSGGMQITVERDGHDEIRRNAALFPPPPQEFSCSDDNASTAHLYSLPPAAGGVGVVQNNNSGEMRRISNQYNGSGVGGTGYGDIFIAVSVDNADDVHMYPDLLNIPNRIKSACAGIKSVDSGSKNNSPLACRSTSSDQNRSQRMGGVGKCNQTEYPSKSECFNVAAERWTGIPGGVNDLNYCAFATLPRKQKQSLNASGNGNSQMIPILVDSCNKSNGNLKDIPWAFQENENVRRNLEASGVTLRRPLNKLRSAVDGEWGHDNKLQYLSTLDTEQKKSWSRSGGEGREDCQVILFYPSQNDNIGRRVTASGNSAIAGTDNERNEAQGISLNLT